MKIINILDFIVKYLRENGRTVDAEIIEMTEDE